MNRVSACLKVSVFSLLVAIGSLSGNLIAQVNIKAGYNFSVLTDPGLNQVISTFNNSQQYSRSFRQVNWLHGFEGGLRFKSDIHAFELSYQSAYQAMSAEGHLLPELDSLTDKINISVNTLAAGYQVSSGLIGGGMDVLYQFYNSRVRLSGKDQFKDRQEMWGMKFYLMFTLEGSGYIDAAIQPYFVLPLDTYNNDPVSQYLNQEAGPPADKWTRIGISIIFYNGNK